MSSLGTIDFQAVGIVTALAMFATPTPVTAEPLVREKVERFEVQRASLEGIREEVGSRSSTGPRARQYHGLTKSAVRFELEYGFDGGQCKVAKVSTIVDMLYHMPLWTEYGEASRELQDKWDAFMFAIWKHAHGHRALAISLASEIETDLRAFTEPAPACTASFRDRAQARAQAIVDQLATRHATYDRETQHGRTQGTGVLFD